MQLSRQDKSNLVSILVFSILVSVGAGINGFIEHGSELYPVLSESVIGFLFGAVAATFEIYFFERRLRRVAFLPLLILRTLFYFAICGIIIIAVAASRVGFRNQTNYYDAFGHESFISYISGSSFTELLIYCVLLSFAINFVRQISKLLGQKVLINFIRGKYQIPVEEELIFMFLDLKSSTTIAEKLGHKRNHEFLNDFFHDMTDSILEHKANIYQYVGDEVVLVWSLKEGKKDLNCLNCFYSIKEQITKNKRIYLEKYEVYPQFKAGLHSGKVISGEIGDIKKDIVYHGDTVNTASRIQSECNKYGKELLISEELLKVLETDNKFKKESIGNILLRGKEKALELYSLEKN